MAARRDEATSRRDPRVRRRAGLGAPAPGGSAVRTRSRHELLGRIVECDDAPARADALRWTAACRAARRRHPRSTACRPPRRRQPQARRSRRADSMHSSTSIVRKYAPLPGASLSALVRRLRYAVPQWHGRLSGGAAADQTSPRARARRRCRLVLAGRGDVRCRTSARRSPTAGAVRSARVGSPSIRTALGLGLPVRGVHACGEAEARILRAAIAVARARRRVGQRRSHGTVR